MGGGYYDERDMDEAPAAAGGQAPAAFSQAAAAAMVQTSLHQDADPSNVRLACVNPSSVVVAVDVTGHLTHQALRLSSKV